jgi:transposase
MDEEGRILEEFPFPNNDEGVQRLLKCSDGKCKAVIESTCNLWLRIYEALKAHGVEVKLTNPYKTKAMASARSKQIDSRPKSWPTCCGPTYSRSAT